MVYVPGGSVAPLVGVASFRNLSDSSDITIPDLIREGMFKILK